MSEHEGMGLPLEAKRIDGKHVFIFDSDGAVVLKMSVGPEALGLARHIVKCVNSHGDMFATLGRLYAATAAHSNDVRNALHSELVQARDVLERVQATVDYVPLSNR